MSDDTRFSDDLPERMGDPARPPDAIPWALLGYFDGELDLIQELAACYPHIAIMSLFHTRSAGTHSPRRVATIATQDGAASLIVEVDMPSKAVQFTFVVGSLIGARFRPGALSPLDRAAWLEPMRREQGEVAFLWNARRWAEDYLISAATRSFAYLFAFSPRGIQAAARLTPETSRRLIEWLEDCWSTAAA